MGKKSFLLLLAVWMMFLMVSSCTWESQHFYDNGVSDEEYISIARGHDDARAFLERYPQAKTYVDRSGTLAVDFRVAKHPLTSTTQQWEGIRLRVFIDPKKNQPTETFIQCDNRILKNNLQQYLGQYFATQICP